MNNRPRPSDPLVEPNSPDWVAVSLGLMTIATIIAAATAAAAISVVIGDTDDDATTLTTIAAAAAVASLFAYYGVVVTGLAALFRPSPTLRRRWATLSAVLLTGQVSVVVVFALLTIVEPLLSAAG